MNVKSIGVVLVLLVVTVITSFNVATTRARVSQQSAVASPTHAMLREIVQEMKAGRHERALRMTQRLELGLHEYLNNRGPTPEQFIHEVYASE